MGIRENADPTEPTLDPVAGLGRQKTSQDFLERPEEDEFQDAPQYTDSEILQLIGGAKRYNRRYQQTTAIPDWEKNHAAYRSVHSSSSKYHRPQYKNRAKYFKPKTRAAVRKNLTSTANALFISDDVISIEPANEADPMQRASSALVKEIINARLTNKTRKSGLPWFQTVIGARQDAQITGVCASKQQWTYKTVEKTRIEQVESPALDEYGQPLIDPETGEPFIQVTEEEVPYFDVIKDKPEVILFPAEMALVDPGSSWIDPAQNSPTLIVQWPMHVSAVQEMMQDDDKNQVQWREVTDEQLAGAMFSETELQGLKTSRDGSANSTSHPSPDLKGNRNEIVDVWECFYQIDGVDMHCWSLRDQALLSDFAPTEVAYPEMRGSRPYVLGTDTLEAHVLYPESHVASWRQSQEEINDFTNLHMDATRHSVYPTAKVRAGRNIDYKSVQRRDGQGIILVRDMNDVEWDRPPGPGNNADREVALLSNDFDELAGIFSQNSVQSNRQIGDTVGGMQLISANANATSEFDLRVFIETWVEPVLSQLVFLEQYYEDDVTLLSIAGAKAKLFQKFGVDEITDELLESQINLSLNVGIGGSDPMQKLLKFKTSMELAMPFLGLAEKQGSAVKINFEEVFAEIFGQAGYRNGPERFIEFSDEGEGEKGVPPEKVKQMMEMLQKLQQENEALKSGEQRKAMIEAAKIKDKDKDRQADMALEQIRQRGETERLVREGQIDLALQEDRQEFEIAKDQMANSTFFRVP